MQVAIALEPGMNLWNASSKGISTLVTGLMGCEMQVAITLEAGMYLGNASSWCSSTLCSARSCFWFDRKETDMLTADLMDALCDAGGRSIGGWRVSVECQQWGHQHPDDRSNGLCDAGGRSIGGWRVPVGC